MIEIEKPKIETVELNEDAKYGKFVIEPLERGYGGNYNAFPLGAFWVRNINLKMGQAPVIHF
ncbi:hypothetical protein ACQKJV_28630, partial [Bacillus mobilis]